MTAYYTVTLSTSYMMIICMYISMYFVEHKILLIYISLSTFVDLISILVHRNIFIGVGGPDAINFSHFIGATYGMERMMGRMDNPLRRILHYAR